MTAYALRVGVAAHVYSLTAAQGAFALTGVAATLTDLSVPQITTPNPLPPGTQGAVYSAYQMTATSGRTPYTWQITAGSLDSGLSFSTSGILSGTPANAVTDTFTIQVTDALSNSSSAVFSLTINASATLTPLWPDPLPSGTINVPYSYTLTASGGVPPYTFAVSSGTLPTGLTLVGSTGVISGTPTALTSMDAVTFTVTDSA